MRELNSAEMSLVAGADTVEPIVVTAQNLYLVHQPSDAHSPVDDQGAKPGIGGGSDGYKEIADIVGYFIIQLLDAEQFSQHKIAEREAASTFNVETTTQKTSNGHTWWVEKSDGTAWFDLDGSGKPETHVKVYSDGSAFIDTNFDGKFDAKVDW